ncbi:MAG: hypothetical protein PQ612_06145 [Rickettsiales bacterium]|nr:hypothetical protein [Pseudomonadota bacterium]MDA0966552.1 hypothetical protein [Pseudomonadota bacterium]MDG4543581.1 hypothetical protein [Rickettsiales bacterium]MDG4545728.1 hypothetical protein [Rickettsiales bacterium]MDG4547499.1 hypothetical protein [Rickettsiales bacterium]
MPRKIEVKWNKKLPDLVYQPTILGDKQKFYSEEFYVELSKKYGFELPKNKKDLKYFKSKFEYAAKEYFSMKRLIDAPVKARHVVAALNELCKENDSYIDLYNSLDYRTKSLFDKKVNEIENLALFNLSDSKRLKNFKPKNDNERLLKQAIDVGIYTSAPDNKYIVFNYNIDNLLAMFEMAKIVSNNIIKNLPQDVGGAPRIADAIRRWRRLVGKIWEQDLKKGKVTFDYEHIVSTDNKTSQIIFLTKSAEFLSDVLISIDKDSTKHLPSSFMKKKISIN